MSDEKVQLDEWDLSDEMDRYVVAAHLSYHHSKRLMAALMGTLAVSSVTAHAAAGLYFQSDALWYLTQIQFDLARIPAFLATLALWITLYYAWIRYDAPTEEQVRALYDAAEQMDSVYADADA